MLDESHCSATSAASAEFASAANRVRNNNDSVYAFWFITSVYHGATVCGFFGSAHQWGWDQAAMYVDAVAQSGYSGPVGLSFADVEFVGGEECSADLARWNCSGLSSNRDVVEGFQDYIALLNPGTQGVYSSGYYWEEITDNAVASEVGGHDFWLAFWGPTQGELNFAVAALQNWGYTVASWQYSVDTYEQGGNGCLMTYSEAADLANTASNQGYYVLRYDAWDNDNVIQVLEEVPDDCD